MREVFQKDIDIFEIYEVDVKSELYKEVVKEGKLVYIQAAGGDFPGGACHY